MNLQLIFFFYTYFFPKREMFFQVALSYSSLLTADIFA